MAVGLGPATLWAEAVLLRLLFEFAAFPRDDVENSNQGKFFEGSDICNDPIHWSDIENCLSPHLAADLSRCIVRRMSFSLLNEDFRDSSDLAIRE